MDLPELYKKQISLTEWFEKIDYKDTDNFREEDNLKRQRMRELSKIIDFPFDKPTSFSLVDVVEKRKNFLKFQKDKGKKLCALRFIPIQEGLPKLRMRGMTANDVIKDWLPKQDVDPNNYQADFVPHPSDHLWSSIFVVGENGIMGEIVKGSHNQLTQGFYDEDQRPYQFFYNFENITINPQNKEVEEHAKKILLYLLVKPLDKQKLLKEKIDSTFAHDYLCGYFETVESVEYGLWFVDYNRVLGETCADLDLNFVSISKSTDNNILIGTMASPGKAVGNAKIINIADLENAEFNKGDILLCNMTTPDYLPLMKKAGAIVTKEGGVLSHAAIISRELGIPSVVGISDLLDNIQNGDKIEVDADRGIILI